MARTTGAFYVLGGVLGLTITAVAPGDDGNRALVGTAAAIALVLGLTLLAWGPRMPHALHHAYLATAAVLVTGKVPGPQSMRAATPLRCFHSGLIWLK